VDFTAIHVAIEIYAYLFGHSEPNPSSVVGFGVYNSFTPEAIEETDTKQKRIILIIKSLVAAKANINHRIVTTGRKNMNEDFSHYPASRRPLKNLQSDPSDKTVLEVAQSFDNLLKDDKKRLINLLKGKPIAS